MVILENIDIDKAILQNIDIDKISNRFKFGISNRAICPSLAVAGPQKIKCFFGILGYLCILFVFEFENEIMLLLPYFEALCPPHPFL